MFLVSLIFMARQPEGKLCDQIVETIRMGWERSVVQKNSPNGRYSAPGIPDLTGAVEGRAFAFEVKMPARRSRVSDSQREWLDLYGRAGAVTGVICSPQEAVDLLEAAGL